VLCGFVINNQLFSVVFQAQAQLTVLAPPTPSQSLPALNNLTGVPSCVSAPPTAICTARTANGLIGFTLQYNRATANSIAGVSYINALTLPSAAFTGDPGCAQTANSPNTSGVTVTCAIVGNGALLGTTFDLQAGVVTPPSTYQSLGSPSDGGTWSGAVSCATIDDGRGAIPNLTTCAALSASVFFSDLFVVTFDPRSGINEALNGPLASELSSSIPSCLRLNIDQDRMYCGAIGSAGAATGFNLPVGFLTPAASSVATAAVIF
jgi:hypothetical protein